MELDDLKQAWRKDAPMEAKLPDDITKWATGRIDASRKALYRTVTTELVIVIMAYALMLAVIAFSKKQIPAFFYKTWGVATLGAIPISIRLIQSLRKIGKDDHSVPMVSHLEKGIKYFKHTIRLYRISTYVMLVVLVVLYLNDPFFASLSWEWKAGVFAYLLVFAAITDPYVNRFYGRRIRNMEEMLEQLKGNGLVSQ